MYIQNNLKLGVKYWQQFVKHNFYVGCKKVNFTGKIDFATCYVKMNLYEFTYINSRFVHTVNVIYSLFTDKIHTIYILMEENLSSVHNCVEAIFQ